MCGLICYLAAQTILKIFSIIFMNKYVKAIVENYYNKDADSYLSDIQGFENYSVVELMDIVEEYCQEIIENNDLDAKIVDTFVHGSRVRGTSKEDSDLDVVVFYTGSIREDSLFNILHEEEFVFENVVVDINPIHVSDSISKQLKEIENYKKRSQEYDISVLNNLK